ncbi:MATE family efflux transporter [[Clostridium] symbiosum]|uniref:MATE family efflux transporter n=1 Tax=Clostridium symbiosum TaxID=1512 RepID=UPI001D08D64C|nr:MATE family efflux transporter [[Clostridium] symbiosum]MCB6611490.1 MATE family efflux transporter [[Clostridium] symbiosum]MCB6930909.1 MATE family efflux transporter [[Clostridium] symbiosum]
MARDMTQGGITKHLLAYAVPLMFANLLQQLYQTVDSIIVGQYNGKEALAAIGAAGPIMNILIFLIVGLSLGASILMSEYFGAHDYDALKAEMATSLVSGFLLTVVLSLLSFAGSGLFITLTRTPAEIAPMAADYLRVISLGLIFTFFYNILSAGLRSLGDARAPLYVLCITTVLHVLLAVYMVGRLNMGVQGAAYATVISQAVSSLMLFLYIKLKVPYLRLTLTELRIRMDFLRKTIDFSAISALQQTVLYIGRLLVQSGINTLGVDAVAAFNAVSIIDSYILAPGDSLAASVTTFTAQNKGAKQYKRIPTGLKTVVVMAEIYIITISALVLIGKNQLLGIFLKPEEVEAIRIGTLYIVPMACFYFISGFTNSFQGYFRGIGNLRVTLIATVIQIPIRVILTYSLLGRFGIQAVVIGTTLGWICMTLYELIFYRKYGIH